MAAILMSFLYLSLGFAIGAFWVWRRGSKARAGAIISDLSAEWERHLAEHAEAQKGSVVWTGPSLHVHGNIDSTSSVAKIQEMIEESNTKTRAALRRAL